MSLIQRPFGPFCDFDIFVLDTEQRPTRFHSRLLFKLQMLVEQDGELRFGGVDDVYEQWEQGQDVSDEEDDLFEIHQSLQTMRHRFFGTVQVKDRNLFSDKGCELLKEAGADLTTLDEGGEIYVVIRAIFHRYETTSFSQDNGTWITSVNGSKDNPRYLTYRVASHHRATYKHCRVTRERSWWLEFVRHCCKTEPVPPKGKGKDKERGHGKSAAAGRTMTWLVRCYRELFPFHESGVHPASKGNPKSTQLGEVHIALARNADFIYKKLKVARASTMSLSEWEKHKELYDRSSVSREPFYEAASESESEEEIFSDEEDKDDNYGMDFEPMPPVLANRGAESLRREPSRELTRDASVAGGLYEEASEVLNFPSVDAELSLGTEKKSTIKYRPILRPNFQWNCPFNSLVAAPDEAHKYQCVWKINLLKLTREQVTSISRELRELVDTPMKNLNNPSLSVLLAALLDPHLVKHSKRRSGMKSIAGVYQVEVPIDPSAADWVARASNINRRLDPESSVIRYQWHADPGREGMTSRP